MEEVESAEVEPNFGEKSLIDVVFSWSIKDIFNSDLYKNKVKQIPKTFLSTSSYMRSFIFPLIEETRADLCSNIEKISSSSICKIHTINENEDYECPRALLYDVLVERKRESDNHVKLYEPEPGDLIAITDVRPKCIDDLDKPTRPFLLALIQWVRKDEEFIKLIILSSKPIDLQQNMQRNVMENTLLFVSLSNLTTHIRIWKALHLELDGKNTGIIEKVLLPDPSTVRILIRLFFNRCKMGITLCLREGIYRASISTIDPVVRQFNLNDSQKDAVLKCIAAKSCNHKNTVKVKLIWGPPGTGKTKTISVLLYSLLGLRCKTLTCAPTNIAVLEVTKRLQMLVVQKFTVENYGLGDLILVGHSERLKIDDNPDLLNIFLNHRVQVLVKCFAPSSGWKHCLAFMISLLEDPEKLFLSYLEKDKKEEDEDAEIDDDENTVEEGQKGREKNCRENREELFSRNLKAEKTIWGKVIAQTFKKNKTIKWNGKVSNQEERNSTLEREVNLEGLLQPKSELNLEEYFEKRFNSKREMLNYCIANFITHLPTCCISLIEVKSMIKSLNLLEYLRTMLKQLLDQIKDEKQGKMSYSVLNMARNECLQILRSFDKILTIPNLHNASGIKLYCLENACLFFCTTSSSAKLHVTSMKFLVVDEASMLKECESVIPFQIHGLRHAIAIGDDRQLPALVKSKISKEAEFGRSLFGRLVLLDYKKHLLNFQYRMHPSISLFPKREFYQNQILDAPTVKQSRHQKRFLEGDIYGPYSFINVPFGKEEVGDGRSLRNMVEVALVAEVVASIFKEITASKQKVSIGIISPYNAQVDAIQDKLGTAYNDLDFSASTVRSIDGFQGGEDQDVIIISTVRHNVYGSVGFLDDRQRTNVALTRARYCLWIFGNEATLRNSGSVWKKLILDAKSRGCFHNAQEDKNLAIALTAALIDVDLVDVQLYIDSLPFKDARWKVSFDGKFWNSIANFKNLEVRKEALSLLIKLSSGWRSPHNVENLDVKDWIFAELVEFYKVSGRVYILWSIDIEEECSRYNQVLKVWDILPLSKIPDLAKHLDKLIRIYPADIIDLCKVRFMEGSLEVPMAWPVNSVAGRNSSMQLLCSQFDAMTLKDDESCVSATNNE